ncbi:unnamed protein product [Thelazia callipaeda]|uniref:Copine domain-containing protein n=1 Tax=Thelazia callipaeda TaxID=103827 RepID=A0A0N5D9H4_THECL|nr:unnamed protein product [Thelazia callipaeda]
MFGGAAAVCVIHTAFCSCSCAYVLSECRIECACLVAYVRSFSSASCMESCANKKPKLPALNSFITVSEAVDVYCLEFALGNASLKVIEETRSLPSAFTTTIGGESGRYGEYLIGYLRVMPSFINDMKELYLNFVAPVTPLAGSSGDIMNGAITSNDYKGGGNPFAGVT